MGIIRRELVYIWYYFTVQLEQIFGWWVLGMVIGSAVFVFARDYIHRAFSSLKGKRLGVSGILAASRLGIASPLCMYGTIPIAASFSRGGGAIPLLQQWLWDGMSVGSAASFMLTGPSTKITNLGALKIVLGIKRFLLYLAYVMVFSFVTGLLVNLIINK